MLVERQSIARVATRMVREMKRRGQRSNLRVFIVCIARNDKRSADKRISASPAPHQRRINNIS